MVKAGRRPLELRSYRITTVLHSFLNAAYCGIVIASLWIDQDEFMMKFENIDGGKSQVLPESSAQPAPKPALHDPRAWHSNGHPDAGRQETNLNGSGSSPKIVLYSHDTFGMGNIRRTLLLSQEFITEYPGASILIITGSPMIHAFRIPKALITSSFLAWTGLQRKSMRLAILPIAPKK